MKPSIAEFLTAAGHSTFPPALIKQASDLLYGNIGAGLDQRDWDSILSSGNALEAAQTALEQQYQDPDYLKENADHLRDQGYSAAQIEKTYRDVKAKLVIDHDTSWADGTVYQDAASKSDSELDSQAQADVPDPVTFEITAETAEVGEGDTASFTIAAGEGADPLTEGTKVAYTIGGGVDADDIDGDLTSTAVIGADGTATIDVALTEDGTTEGAETLTLSLDGTNLSSDVTVNDTSAVGDTYTLDAESNTFFGTANNDTFDATTPGTLGDSDSIDGADGEDTLNVRFPGHDPQGDPDTGIAPGTENIEIVNVDSRDSNANALSFESMTDVERVSVTGNSDVDVDVWNEVPALSLNNYARTLQVDLQNLLTSVDGTALSVNLDDATGALDIQHQGDLATLNLVAASGENDLDLQNAGNLATADVTVNVSGEADLRTELEWNADLAVDATNHEGAYSLALLGAGTTTLADQVSGSVAALALHQYANSAEIDATGLTDLSSIALAATSTNSLAGLDLAAGVEVSLVATGNAGSNDITLNIDGAADDDASSLTFNIGGDAQVEAGNLTVTELQNLTINATGDEDGNSIQNGVTADLESLTVNADVDFTADGFSAADGAADESNTMAITTAGAGDIALGRLNTNYNNNVNAITLDNSGAGERSFTIGDEGDLKAAESTGQAVGEGLTISGDGTGDVTVTSSGVLVDALSVDGTGYAGNVLLANAATSHPIDAQGLDGVDSFVLTGKYQSVVSNLGADISVVSTDSPTEIGIENATGVTEQDVRLASAIDATLTATVLTANDVATLNIVTDDENMEGTDRDHTVTTLNATSLETLNVEAAEEAPFVLTNAYTTRDGVDGNRDVAANVTGAGDITLDGGLTSGTGIDNIAIMASGEGARDLGTVTTSDMSDSGNLTITGDSDVVIDNIVDTGATGISVNLNSDADADVTDMNVTMDAAATFTINAESSDGLGENDIADAGGISFDFSTLTITGNQDLIVGSGTALGMTSANGELNTLDASAFEGTLTLSLTRGDVNGGDPQTVMLGTGDADIDVDNTTTDGSEDVFSYAFSEEGIGDVSIDNVSLADNLDVLDFSAFFAGTVTFDGMSGTAEGSSGVVAVDDVDVMTVTLGENGNDAVVTANDGQFDGSITLTGVTDLADLATDNFT